MATAAPAFEDRRMSIGRVFQRAFSTIGHNAAVVLAIVKSAPFQMNIKQPNSGQRAAG